MTNKFLLDPIRYLIRYKMLRNHSREAKIFDCWKRGYTIDETRDRTGIPRSTVGYYMKRFRRQFANDQVPKIHNRQLNRWEVIARGEYLDRLREFKSRIDDLKKREDYLQMTQAVEAYFALKRFYQECFEVNHRIDTQVENDLIRKIKKNTPKLMRLYHKSKNMRNSY